jgi:hypothetical protein
MIVVRNIGYVYLSATLNIMFMDSYSRSIAAATPLGTTIWNECEIAPEGFLARDGSEVSRTTYSRLFALIGTRYGEGDGETTFNIGDFRDCFIRGAGGTLAAAPGTKQLDGAPNITGAFTLGRSSGYSSWASGAFYTSSSQPLRGGTDGSNNAGVAYFDASISSASYGRDETTEVRPTNYSLYPYIKY